MRRRDHYWSLFHLPEKRQINDLRTDHVEAVFEALPQSDQKDWLVWREGFRTWKPFADFPQLLQSLRQAMRSAPPAESNVPSPLTESPEVSISTDAIDDADAPASWGRLDDIETGSFRGSPVESESEEDEEQIEKSVSFSRDSQESNRGPAVDPSAKTVIQPSSELQSKQKTQTGVRQQSQSVKSAPPAQLPAKPTKKKEEVDRNSETAVLSTTAAMSERTAIAHRLSKQDDSDLDLSIVVDHGADKRHARFPKRWEVRIHGTTGIQSNMTLNVSMHGMQLRDPLPKSLSHYFHVEIKAGNHVIPVVCSALRPASDGSARVKIEVNDYPNALQSALIDPMN